MKLIICKPNIGPREISDLKLLSHEIPSIWVKNYLCELFGWR